MRQPKPCCGGHWMLGDPVWLTVQEDDLDCAHELVSEMGWNARGAEKMDSRVRGNDGRSAQHRPKCAQPVRVYRVGSIAQ